MIDCICYWAKEYHVDGFRFDLMGLHDTETMNEIRAALSPAGWKRNSDVWRTLGSRQDCDPAQGMSRR